LKHLFFYLKILYFPNCTYSSPCAFHFDDAFLNIPHNIKPFNHKNINNPHSRYANISGAAIIIIQKIIKNIGISFI
jgi:hypothetical protein